MDLAYDHIQGQILTSNDNSNKAGSGESDESTTQDSSQRQPLDLNAEFQETFRGFSDSPLGARLGGLWGNVRRQGESYYQDARQEYSAASEEAIKGFADLRDSIISRTRGMSLSGGGPATTDDHGADASEKDEGTATPTSPSAEREKSAAQNENENEEGLISRVRTEAAKRLKDIEKAEEAVDEALAKFGSNVQSFLRDAVTVAPPETAQDGSSNKKLLFESKDGDGKRVIHTTRFEAQLHAIHTNLDSLSKDPESDEWPKWKESFNVDNKSDEIASDLENYPELRKAMESLVPEKVESADFWRRYYFLRLVIETEEKKRKELLKASTDDDEEIGWDEDSDSDSGSPSTPQVKVNKQNLTNVEGQAEVSGPQDNPKEHRQSNDQQSQADSDASYDIVSGTTSRTPGSPKEKEKSPSNPSKIEESDEEDWE